LLTLARERAPESGYDNVQAQVADARRLDLEAGSFDAAISRLALMLIPERNLALGAI
jgi:ubiquinone/menaquinone biosynthesis C-methylase UbiE